MTSFKQEIEKKKESHAYALGAKAFHEGYMHKLVVSPFEKNSTPDLEWLDGFYDSWYINMMER